MIGGHERCSSAYHIFINLPKSELALVNINCSCSTRHCAAFCELALIMHAIHICYKVI